MLNFKPSIDTNIIIANFLSTYEKNINKDAANFYQSHIGKRYKIPKIVISELYHFLFKKMYRKISKNIFSKDIGLLSAYKSPSIISQVNITFNGICQQMEKDKYCLELDYLDMSNCIFNYKISPTDYILANNCKLRTFDSDLLTYINDK